uniref:TERF1-interacting nuclear factor 2 N-terminal domain-containing protein n=1 Tax=Esox lucius TaxID=8010 RepID=A0AAY5KXU0_ESOLU
MGEHICGINGPFLPLPSLRLMISPLRLVSAAIWQTVQQRHVMDYGMLEEFVTMVTEIVPEILNNSQRAQLILGLRAQLVLELCRSKQIADLKSIQYFHSLFQATDAGVGLSESHFLILVQTLLIDPDEREHFFQVSCGYGIKLMWQFLSRLEKLLPAASLLSDVPSILEECLESVSHPQQLKTLLQYHRDLNLLDSHALCLPPVERVVVTAEQTKSEEQGSSIEFLRGYILQRVGGGICYTDRVHREASVIVIKREEGLEFEKNEKVSLETKEKEPMYKTVMVIGEDGRNESLVRNKPQRVQNNASDMLHGKKCGKPIPSQMNRIDLSDNIIVSMLHKSSVELQRIDTTNLTFPFGPETFKHSHTSQTHQRPCLLGTQQQEDLPSGEGKTAFTTYEEDIAQTSTDHRACKVCGKTMYRIGYLPT